MNADAEKFWRGNERRLSGRLTAGERLASYVLDRALWIADIVLGSLAGAEQAGCRS